MIILVFQLYNYNYIIFNSLINKISYIVENKKIFMYFQQIKLHVTLYFNYNFLKFDMKNKK